MSCCGGQRLGTIRPATHDSLKGRPAPTIAFVYTGSSSLTMIGGATGRAYRFEHPGCSLALDARDAPSATGITVLRRDVPMK